MPTLVLIKDEIVEKIVTSNDSNKAYLLESGKVVWANQSLNQKILCNVTSLTSVNTEFVFDETMYGWEWNYDAGCYYDANNDIVSEEEQDEQWNNQHQAHKEWIADNLVTNIHTYDIEWL